MRKIWKFFFGIILGLILTCVACTTMSSINSVSTVKSSYFELCDFDFIIPNPWYTQVNEIKNKDFVDNIVPYYVTKKKLNGNSKICDINLFMIEPSYGLENTAYSESLVCEGNLPLNDRIMVDSRTKNVLGINVGDEVSVQIGKSIFKYIVSGIVYDNKFSNYPTAIISYDGNVRKEIENSIENLAYSGAYIKASNISLAENYFTKEYRAMGKVGDRSWYETEDSFEFMKESIEKQSVSKEIINVYQLRAAEQSNIVEKKKSNLVALLLTMVIVFLGNIVIWFLYLLFSSKTYRERIKAGTKQSSIVFEFIFGEFFTFITLSVCIYLLKAKTDFSSVVSIVVSSIFSFILIAFISYKTINRKRKTTSK